MRRKRLVNLLKVLASLVLIVLLLSQIGFQQVMVVFSQANMYYWLLGLGISLLGVVIRTLRWQILLGALGINVATTELVQLNFIGLLFSSILPTRIGGDVAKIYELSKDGKRVVESINTIFVDGAMGLVVAQFMATMAAVLGHKLVSSEVLIITTGLLFSGLFGVWLLTQERLWELVLGKARFLNSWEDGRWTERIRRFYKAFRGYDRDSILRALGVSFVLYVTRILSIYLVGLALGADVSPLYFFIFVPIVSLVTMIPISLNGLGVRELSYVTLFSQAGVTEQVAFSIALSIYAFSVIAGLIGGGLYLLRGARGYLAQEARG
jgi:uncharacterized protein (TIRG00374 family)